MVVFVPKSRTQLSPDHEIVSWPWHSSIRRKHFLMLFIKERTTVNGTPRETTNKIAPLYLPTHKRIPVHVRNRTPTLTQTVSKHFFYMIRTSRTHGFSLLQAHPGTLPSKLRENCDLDTPSNAWSTTFSPTNSPNRSPPGAANSRDWTTANKRASVNNTLVVSKTAS